ncbi:MAG: tetratricopeptide repeat protein, partial [Planctomycetota bacterium]
MALSGLILALIGVGIFGCQGCQSGKAVDYGDPDSMLKKEGGEDGPARKKAGPAEATPSPEQEEREKKLVEKIRFIENAMLQIVPTIKQNKQDDEKKLNDKILAAFLKALEDHPEDPRYMVLLGQAYLRLEEFDKARKIFEAALEKDPELWPAVKGLALSWVKVDKEKAHEALKRLRDPAVPGPWGYILIGEFFETGGDNKEAEKYFKEGRIQFPKSIHPLLKLVQLYGGNEEWEKAFHMSQKATELAPKNQRAWFFEGQLHIMRAYKVTAKDPDPARLAQSHVDLAITALEKCWKIDPNSEIGQEAKRNLDRLKDPLQRIRKIVLDPGRSLDERKAACAMLLRRPKKAGIDFWKKVIDLPEWVIRMIGLKGVILYGGPEAVEI